jgi:hypothetical protein
MALGNSNHQCAVGEARFSPRNLFSRLKAAIWLKTKVNGPSRKPLTSLETPHE